jgi:hypothetical protein
MVAALTDYLGQTLQGDAFFLFVDAVQNALPNGISRITVHNSVKHLLKKELTRWLLVETCWRLAGNINALVGSKPVARWTRQENFEWIPGQICEIQTIKKHGQLMHEMSIQSLSGSIVPAKLNQLWSLKKTSYLATYRNEKGLGFGFGRSRVNRRGEQTGRNLFYDVRQFYGLRCYFLLDPKKSQPDPVAIEVGHTAATMNYNRTLIVARDRTITSCIKGLPDTQECYHCPYGTDKCVLATHAKTYTIANCSCCCQSGFFDPAEREYSTMCVNCVFTERKK